MTGPVVEPVQGPRVAPPTPAFEPRGTRATLRFRDYRLLLATQLAIGLTQPILFFAQGWYVNSAAPDGRQILYLGALGASRGLAFIAYVTVGGAVTDRFPRRRVLRASQSAAALLILAIAGLLFVPAIRDGQGWSLPAMVAVFASFGLIQAQDAPNRTALLRDAVPPTLLTGAIALFQLVGSSALLLAAPFAGFAIERMGIATTYAIAACGPLAVLAVTFRLRAGIESADPDGRAASLVANLRDGVRVLRDEPVVRWTVLLTWMATAAGLSVMGILVAAWVSEVLHLDASGWGLMALFWGAGSLASTCYLAWRGEVRHKGRLFIGAGLLFGVSVLGFSLSRSLPLAFAFNGLAGLSFMAYQTLGLTIVTASVPNRLLGRVTGLLLLGGGLMQVWALAVGVLAEVFGIEAVYVAAGVAIVAITALVGVFQAPLRDVD